VSSVVFSGFIQEVDLDRQSLSSIDRNASERGQSQLSNPTDDSWKGRPYASKILFCFGLFWVFFLEFILNT
jgi:hypothetical protein